MCILVAQPEYFIAEQEAKAARSKRSRTEKNTPSLVAIPPLNASDALDSLLSRADASESSSVPQAATPGASITLNNPETPPTAPSIHLPGASISMQEVQSLDPRAAYNERRRNADILAGFLADGTETANHGDSIGLSSAEASIPSTVEEASAREREGSGARKRKRGGDDDVDPVLNILINIGDEKYFPLPEGYTKRCRREVSNRLFDNNSGMWCFLFAPPQ